MCLLDKPNSNLFLVEICKPTYLLCNSWEIESKLPVTQFFMNLLIHTVIGDLHVAVSNQ